jgi:hypothetical protein
MNNKLEIHEHRFTSGDRAGILWLERLIHSHEGGNDPHRHPETGPACYTVDRLSWRKNTGLKGGGRKRFTARPGGEQLPIMANETPAKVLSFPPEIRMLAEAERRTGDAIASRMIKAMTETGG